MKPQEKVKGERIDPKTLLQMKLDLLDDPIEMLKLKLDFLASPNKTHDRNLGDTCCDWWNTQCCKPSSCDKGYKC